MWTSRTSNSVASVLEMPRVYYDCHCFVVTFLQEALVKRDIGIKEFWTIVSSRIKNGTCIMVYSRFGVKVACMHNSPKSSI